MNRHSESLTLEISGWALRCPEKIAIRSEGQSVSYRELEKTSNRIANFFQRESLETPNIIILLDRSAALIESIIGLLKCGLVFVPVDPFLPPNRIKKMVEISRAGWVITNNAYYEKFQDILDSHEGETGAPSLNVLLIDAGQSSGGDEPRQNRFYLNNDIKSTDLTFERVFNEHCYIYFTSGSTGTPKGILGRQKGLIHFIQWERDEFGVDEHFNVSQLTPPSFDVFLRDIFLPLTAGGTCCIPSREAILDMKELIRWINNSEITLIHTVPSLFKQLVSEIETPHCFGSVKYILLAGELLRGEDIRQFTRLFKQRIRLVNIYGPTETTLAKLFYRIQPGDENRSIIPVGKPIDGAQVLILGSQMQKCRTGQPGEIYIRTPFRSAGYYNQPGLTESVFIKNPYGQHPNDLIYKTGDLGRQLPDGNIEVTGRVDFQVKIRGVRIETGEIENRLLMHPGIRDAVVGIWNDPGGDKYLCAYVIPTSGQRLQQADLIKYLAADLPDAMIPSYFVQMERFPLTASGKIDRNVLPVPAIETEENFASPTNEIEKRLLKMWSEVLHKDEDKISVQANFFEMGGHSLRAVALASKIHQEFNVNVPVAEFFKAMTIRGISEYIQGTGKEQHLGIGPTEKKQFYPLSSAQKRLYFLQMVEGSGFAYNIPRVIRLEGKIPVGKLESVFARLIQRHESLRTSFHLVVEEPVQRIHDEVEFEIEYLATEKRCSGQTRTFDLSKAPLLRLGLVKVEEDIHLLLIDMHHIIADGMSLQVLVQDFSALYAGEELPGIRLQYKDYAEWQNHEKVTKKIIDQGEYWKKEFAGEIPVLELPADFARPAVQSFEGNRINFEINNDSSGVLKRLALEAGTTLYMVVLALYSIFLAKLSGREDIVIGSPVAGRRHADLEKIIGMFVNTLALRSYPALEKKFTDFLGEVKEKALSAFENQEYPYEDLVEKVVVTRDVSRNPLFDAMFTLQNADLPGTEIPGLKLTPYEYENKTAKFDLSLTAVEIDEKFVFTFEYCIKLFRETTVKRFIVYFVNIIQGVVENTWEKISDFELIPVEEKRRILFEFNDNERDYPKDETIHELFAEQAERTPDYIALVGADLRVYPVSLSYNVLNEQSDQLAGLLIEQGVLTDNIVAIMMERSAELIVGIMGILKSGGAYLPIEPDLPRERIDYMLKDSGAKFLVNEKFFAPLFFKKAGRRGLHLSNQLAYVIYTSGSTGRPKGVMVEHRGLVNYIWWAAQKYVKEERVDFPFYSSISFDLTVTSIFTPLITGNTIIIYGTGAKELLMDKIIDDNRVALIKLTPSHLKMIREKRVDSNSSSIKRLIVGGESFETSLAQDISDNFAGKIEIYNEYGPTEAVVGCMLYRFDPERDRGESISIGSPIDNIRIYILDKYMKPVPIGVLGEIYIGSAGIARGYLNNPELTVEKFIKYRSYRTDRTYINYKTGDLARWSMDGNVEFIGRIDQQAKIRGYRIELGEIENRLLKHETIKEAVVLMQEAEKGDSYLCAYVVSRGENGDAELRKFLARELPDYMIPSYFIALEKIPLTPNGKIDRSALPKPGLHVSDTYTAARNDIERKLVELWSEILGYAAIGIDDNFFQLGGHSLKATILAAKIHKVFEVKVPLIEIFKTPRIRELAKYVKEKGKEVYLSIEPTEEKEHYKLSPAQERLYILQQLATDNISYNMPYILTIEKSVEPEKLESAFKKLIERHESFRTSFIIVNEEPVQRICRLVDFSVEYYEIKDETGLIPLISGFIRPFEFAKAPLLRVNLITVGAVGSSTPARRVLFVDMHHIIADGTSQDILAKEFSALYAGADLSKLWLQYKDYSEWYNRLLRQEPIKQQEVYWLKEFSTELPVLNLPTDFPRPSIQSFEGDIASFDLSVQETSVLKTIARESEATLYMVLLAIFNILLAKLSSQEDIIIGTPIAARRHTDLSNVIGMLVNTLAMRNYPSGDKVFKDFLREVRTRTLEAYENQEYPFEVLVDKITVNRDAGRNPVFDVMFNLLNQADYRDRDEAFEPNEQGSYLHLKRTSKFDMNLTAVECGERLFFTLEYSTRLFKAGSIERVIGYYKNILRVLSHDSGLKIAEIELLDEKEKEEILNLSSGVEYSYKGSETIHGLFVEQAERNPDRVGLVGKVGQINNITYSQLNEQSDCLAGLLIEKGIMADDVVAIMMERSVEMVIGLLGILKSGCAYLPIDPELPQDRIDYILKDSGAKLLVNEKFFAPLFFKKAGRRGLHLSNQLAYVIYTSGSTGKPKGVMLEHRNLVNLIRFQYEYTNIDFNRVLQFTTISFDVSAQEIFSTFLSGGQLFLVNKETRVDIPGLFRFIEKNGIKTVFWPVSFLKAIFKEEEYLQQIPRCIRHITTAGEQLVIGNDLRKYLQAQKVYLHNHYGPSETHVVTTLTIDPAGNIAELPSIGKPVMNTGIYIMDKWGKLPPPGATGELWIGGVQVGRGYLNKPELTEERFIKYRSNRSYKTYINYKTGDLARFLSDGNIEFLGRIDHQVKIRGFRVEPGEIESRLLNYPGIKEVVVSVCEEETGDKYLCAYVVCAEEYGVSELREYLAKELPDYMIPSFFVRIEKMPLTPSGKVDRKALPKPGLKTGEGYTAPRNEIEKKLAALWAEILDLHGPIGIDDNFFELGGHSLKATIIISRIEKIFSVKIPLAEIFKNPRIRELARYIKAAAHSEYHQARLAEKKEYYVLSSAQRRLYLLWATDKNSASYNISSIMILEGTVDKHKLEQSIRGLIRRHESLRTSFIIVNEDPVQRISNEVEFEIEYLATDVTVGHGQTRIFELSKAPLLRVGLAKVEEEKHLFFVDMHHIISDGMSIQVLVQDFSALYAGEELPGLKLQYKDYAEWQNREKISKNILEQGEFWQKEFKGDLPVLELPTDFARPAVQSFEGDRINFELSSEISEALKFLALQEGATLYLVLLALYSIFLAKLTGREDIVIGSPVAGRRHADLGKIIGMFVNTLALRSYPTGEKIFADFLGEIKERTLNAFENQEYQYEDLVEKVVFTRDVSRNPLFDTMFTLQNTDLRGIEIPGLNLVPYEYENKTAKFDLTLIGMEIKEKLFLRLEYSTRLFKETSIERFKRYFLNLVKQATEKTRGKICDFELITAEEKKRILFEFNDTEREYPKDKTIHELFAGQVEKSPDHVGVVGQVGLSYRKLNEQSDQLAGLLIEKGVLPDSIVGIMVGRCVEMVIGLMGILKSGCAYLPIDPELPRERIDYMLKDSGAKFLVNEKFFAPLFFKKAGRRGLHHSNQLAYIIYTSGSTGKPKGVMVEHRSLVNLCWWHNNYYSVTSWDRASKYAGFGFDASVWEIFPYLAAGASLYIVPDEIILDIAALNGYFERNGITIGFLPTQICEEFLLLRNTSLRVLLVGGDRLRNYVSNNYALYNNYGPTENTVVSTSFCVTGEWVNIPIGAPIFNNRVYIMDRYHRLQPIEVPGEIVVGGDSVARGYLNRPELTAEKFIKYRSYRTDRTYINYKTGDLGRWLESGNIEFLGRIDQQVKIRGARVESAEIENELLTHPGIREAVVVAKVGNDGQYLCAYLTPKDSNDVEPQDSLMLTRELQDYLLNRLPHYMVPGHFVMLEKMPLTSSGKVDRRLLSSKNEFSPVSGVTYVAPGNDMEQIVADIWKEILHLEEVGIHDNFFALGGSSITLLKVNSRLEIKLEKSLPVVKMFKYPTVHTFASYLLQGDDELLPSESIEKEKLISGKMDRGKDRLKERSRRRYQGK